MLLADALFAKATSVLQGYADEDLASIASCYAFATSERGRADEAIVAIDASGDGVLRDHLRLFTERLREDKAALAEVEKTIENDRRAIQIAEYYFGTTAQTPGSFGNLRIAKQMYLAVRRSVHPFDEGGPAYRSKWQRQFGRRTVIDAETPQGIAEAAQIHLRIAEKAEADRNVAARNVSDREKILGSGPINLL